ncbi:serine/threonine-protein kinase [Catellatospora bangladeshensis]|uniref:serine/threonine-protein kinase n=1 Tax=Catellatospora bangladeshensis TaxID=310355 RepID=UPI003612E4A1
MVWLATDESLKRDVAVKEVVPPAGLTTEERDEMYARSMREARAIARVSHPNVVRIFDVVNVDGRPWIVMERLTGRSLAAVMAEEGPLAPERVADIGLGVLAALRAAHNAGMLHRDVKPANVMVGDDGRVVLTDFGLATLPGDPAVTRTGFILGSPSYIAPERVDGGDVGPAADLWSLGATLYAAVEGQGPYHRPNAMATLAALATEEPTPPRLAGPLKPLLSGLLRKDPSVRMKAAEAEQTLLRVAVGRRGGAAFPGYAPKPCPPSGSPPTCPAASAPNSPTRRRTSPRRSRALTGPPTRARRPRPSRALRSPRPRRPRPASVRRGRRYPARPSRRRLRQRPAIVAAPARARVRPCPPRTVSRLRGRAGCVWPRWSRPGWRCWSWARCSCCPGSGTSRASRAPPPPPALPRPARALPRRRARRRRPPRWCFLRAGTCTRTARASRSPCPRTGG